MAAVEREGRSVALETAYVHDVYDQISTHCPSCSAEGAEGSNGARVWPRVRQFIQDLEPGSLVCDVGKMIFCYHCIFSRQPAAHTPRYQ